MNPQHELESYKQQIGKKHTLEQMVDGFREEGFQLKKKMVRFQQIDNVLRSQQYADLLREAVFKAREVEMLQQERRELEGGPQWSEHRLQEIKFKNEVIRDQVEELEYQNEMEKMRTKRLLRQFDSVDVDLNKLAGKKNAVLNQIQSIQTREAPPLEVELQNKIIDRINSECKQKSQMINEDEANLIRSGRYYQFIVNEGLELKKICMSIKQLELQLPQKYGEYVKLKKEQEEMQSQFDKYFENSEIHTEEDLARQEQLLREEKLQLEKQIEEERAKELYLIQNCEEIAKKEAAFKARQLALNKQQEIDRKKTIIKSLLPIVASSDPNVQRDLQNIQQELARLQQQDGRVKEKLQIDHSHPLQP